MGFGFFDFFVAVSTGVVFVQQRFCFAWHTACESEQTTIERYEEANIRESEETRTRA